MAEQTFKLGELDPLPSFEVNTGISSPSNGTNLNDEFSAIVQDIERNPATRVPRKRKTELDFDPEETSSFTRSFESGTEQLKASGRHFLAAGSTALGFDDFADEQIQAAQLNQQKGEQISEGLITNFEQAEDFTDYIDWAVNGLGQVAPSVFLMVVFMVPCYQRRY